jgi:hypothetical protein
LGISILHAVEQKTQFYCPFFLPFCQFIEAYFIIFTYAVASKECFFYRIASLPARGFIPVLLAANNQ